MKVWGHEVAFTERARVAYQRLGYERLGYERLQNEYAGVGAAAVSLLHPDLSEECRVDVTDLLVVAAGMRSAVPESAPDWANMAAATGFRGIFSRLLN